MKFKPAPRNSIDALQAEARLDMEHRRYKDAIAIFKDLLRQEKRPDWEQGLAEAYRLRAFQVAAKAMWQEAIILWENHAKLIPQAQPPEEYLGWLAQTGQYPKLAKCLAEASPEWIAGPFGRRLLETLAILVLQNEKLLASFPAGHPIAKQQPVIKKAIRAFYAGRDEELEDTLQQVSSRSPYRNVRTLLKALTQMGQGRAEGLALLARIEADSPCWGLARLLRQQCQPTGPEQNAGYELPPKQLALIQKINGYSKAQLNLAKDAKKIAKNTSPRMLFNTVVNNRELLGDALSRRFCLGLLVEYTDGGDVFGKAFGKLSLFDRYRILALNAELDRDDEMAVAHWEECIAELGKRPVAERDLLDEALIYRHIAELAKIERPDISMEALEESLKLDPLDQPSYIKLIRLNEQDGELKETQAWLDKGLSRFPKDVELLGLAMNAASRRKAFKKAAAYAKTVLEIDPINSPARHFLIAAHLGHARKQFKTGRYDLAQQELAEARALDSRRRNASLSFLEGFLALKQPGAKPAHELFAEGWQQAGDPLNAQFLLNMETLNLNLTASAIKSSVPGLDKNYIAKPSELLGLVQRMARDYTNEKKLLPEALKLLKPILKKSFKESGLSEDDYFNLCEAFARCAQFDLLGDCAKEAARRFPMAAGPIYFAIYADCKGVATRMTAGQEQRLDMAMGRARSANDHRVGVLIQKFFEALDEADGMEFDEDFLPELQNFESKMTPDFQKRMMELDTMPKAKLADMLAKAMPGLPIKSLSHEDLLNMARMMLMDEMGIDVQRLLGGATPFDPIKKLPKLR